ncbi:hypothetical protein PO472_18740, partial [Atlantibacter hermannii]
SAQIREILISESAWEEMTCLFAPSLAASKIHIRQVSILTGDNSDEDSLIFLIRFIKVLYKYMGRMAL